MYRSAHGQSTFMPSVSASAGVRLSSLLTARGFATVNVGSVTIQQVNIFVHAPNGRKTIKP